MMTRMYRMLFVAVLLVSLPAASWAQDVDASDTGGADADTGVAADTSDDVADANDVDEGDDGVSDVSGEDVADTAGADDAAGDAGADAARDAAGLPDAETLATFSGSVDVQGQSDNSDVLIELTPEENGTTRETRTGSDGDFTFSDLPLGTYEVEISLEGYVTIAEVFELRGDREKRYTLHSDQSAQLRVTAVFPANPPSEVEFFLEEDGSDRRRGPESVEISGREAVWTVDDIGLGEWTVSASASGYRTLAYDFDVTEDDADEQIDVRLYMTTADIEPGVEVDDGCGCASSRGVGPVTLPAALVLLGVIGLRWRDQ